MPKMIRKRKSVDDQSIKIVFDVEMVEALIKYVRCEYVSPPQISAVYDLLKVLDFNQYSYNQDILDRLKLLKAVCKGICENHIRDDSVLLSFIREELEGADEIIANINFEKNQLIDSECNVINKFVNERMQYIYIYQVKDDLIRELSSLDNVGFTSYYDQIELMKDKLQKLMVKLQNVSAPDELIKSFNFSGEDYMNLLARIVEKSKKPSTVLMTGIRQLNAILSPGFQSGRLYTFLGGTGRFKSGTLWNITDQLRQFNPQIIPVENGMRKVLLFVTMENTIYETILRLFDMYNPGVKDIKEMEVEEVAAILRDQGHFEFTSDQGIDIEMRYYSDLEIATSHLYTLIQELADQGKQVIALILDYILKINSAKDHYGDERLRLSYAGRELKALAQYFDIPVITAMQINREGNSILEAGMQENKEDIGRFIGTSFVGQCWDLIQESDWVCFINLEMQRSTGKWFLSFKRLKIRGKKDPMAVDYFNHPFVNNNGIRLEPDVNKPEPISIISLASDLVSIDDSKVDNSARNRPRVGETGNKQKNNDIMTEIGIEGLIKAA
jgi:hypothetical protein